MPTPVPAPAPAPVAPVAEQPAPKAAPAKEKPVAKPSRTEQENPASSASAALLKKAEGYLSANQFDKAIATAESVLAIEPGNRAAKALVAKAKARQMDVLKSSSSLE